MRDRDGVKKCKFCGKPIAVITYGIYRKSVVDAEVVDVVPDPKGEEFVRIDGTKIRGREAELGTLGTEPAYRIHGRSCGRRPS